MKSSLTAYVILEFVVALVYLAILGLWNVTRNETEDLHEMKCNLICCCRVCCSIGVVIMYWQWRQNLECFESILRLEWPAYHIYWVSMWPSYRVLILMFKVIVMMSMVLLTQKWDFKNIKTMPSRGVTKNRDTTLQCTFYLYNVHIYTKK